jgi:heme o synthase
MIRAGFRVMIKTYYQLAKPGIVYGNTFTALAAFLFASGWHIYLPLFLAAIVGVALVIASACVFNNYLDRSIDRKMARTQNRALAAGTISTSSALVYASALGVIGFGLLGFFVNALTAFVALAGFIFYVWIYGAAKRTTSWSTVVGSVSGAMPITVGYTAVVGRLDLGALLLFLILVLWQMPHFYAIAIYRLDEYKAALLPVLPAQKGILRTKISIVCYTLVFTVAASLLTFYGYTGYVYLMAILVIGFVWFWIAVKGFSTSDDVRWARGVFRFSLVALVVFSVALACSPLLP